MFDSHMSFKFHPKMGVWEGGLASFAKKRLDIYRLGLTLMFHAIFATGGLMAVHAPPFKILGPHLNF